VGPYIEYPTVLIGPPAGAVFDLEQLHGRRLALPVRSAARALVDSRHPGVEVVDCADIEACIALVAAGGADATLADVVTAASTMARRPSKDVQIVGAEPQLRRAHSLAVHTKHAALVPLVKRALDHAVDTEMNALKQRWFTRPMRADVLRALAWRYLPWAAGALLLLGVLWAWHTAQLRAQVRRTRRAQQQAEQADAASRRLLAFLAHEVRNSLHAVVAGVELLRAGGTGAAAGAAASPQLAGALADSARATLLLLNNLIDRDRLDSGQLVLRTEPCRLSALVEQVVREMAPAAQQRGLQLVQTAPNDDPLLAVDALRLQQVLRNLLANAVKYSRQGRIDVATLVDPVPDGQGGRWRVQLTVGDQGPGLPAALRDGSGNGLPVAPEGQGGSGAGSGLGLPLCRDLARVMGGRLLFSDRPAGGTLAMLVFDAQAAPAPAAGQERSLRVLLVEGAEAHALLLQRGLEQRGHSVRVAGTLAEARRLLIEGGWELLLCDHRLPDGPLGELLDTLDGLPEPQRSARVLLMTADVDDLPPALVVRLGAEAVLAKSEDLRLLITRVLQAAGEALGSARRGRVPEAAAERA